MAEANNVATDAAMDAMNTHLMMQQQQQIYDTFHNRRYREPAPARRITPADIIAGVIFGAAVVFGVAY